MIQQIKVKFRDLSIKYKFIIGITAILILSIPLLSIVFINQSGTLLSEALEDKVKLLNRNFSIVSSSALQESSFSFLQELIKEVASEDKEVGVLLIADANGTIMATSNEEKFMLFSRLDSEKMHKLIKDRKDKIYSNDEEDLLESIKFIYAAKPLGDMGIPEETEKENKKTGVEKKQKDKKNPGEKDTSLGQEEAKKVDDGLIGVMYLSITTKYLQQSVRRLWIFSLVITLVLLVIGILAGYFTGTNIAYPITQLANNVKEIASGNLDASITSSSKDEIGVLVSDVESMRVSIKDLTENLEAKVEERTVQLQDANDKLSVAMEEIWGEMELAKKIQTVLLPDKPEIDGFDIAAYMEPADEVGGDYYDVINVGGLDWVVIGDVSGHGVPAGLIMMMVQTSIRVVLNQNPSLKPSRLLSIINNTISYNIKQMGEDKYMTITVLAAHEEGKFTFSGLHQDILIYNSNKSAVKKVETTGMWLGVVDDIDGLNKDHNLTMGVGDAMLIYTDGITEAWNKHTERNKRNPEIDMFGNKKLIGIFERLGDRSSEEIKKGIIKELEDYRCDDDITMVILKRTQ